MAKVTVNLTNIPVVTTKLYAWKSEADAILYTLVARYSTGDVIL